MTHITADSSAAGGVLVLFGFLVLVGLYFLPTIIAFRRHVPNAGSVAVINTFLGWSLIGWVVSLAMASRSAPPAVVFAPVVNAGSSSPSVPALPPAGWYPDPTGDPQAERYFDGRQWTPSTRPRQS